MTAEAVKPYEGWFKVSPTKIKDYVGCPRRWYFNYVLNIKPPPSKKMQRGSDVHAKLEEYYQKGTFPEDPKLAAVIALCPPRGDKIMSETWLNIELPDQVIVRQKADLIDLRDPIHPVVYDFKTMGNFNYALTAHQLGEDIQLVSYAYAVASIFCPDALVVSVAHVQIPLDISDYPRIIQTSISIENILNKWNYTESRYIKKMYDDSKKNVKDVTANFGAACNAFGGCAHVGICANVQNAQTKEEQVMSHKYLSQMNEPVKLELTKTKKGLTAVNTKGTEESEPSTSLEYLFVDCLPVGVEVTSFSTFIEPLLLQLAKTSGAADWRLIDYGKGKGLIAAALRDMQEFPSAIYLNTREDVGAVGLEVLQSKAKMVIVGTK